MLSLTTTLQNFPVASIFVGLCFGFILETRKSKAGTRSAKQIDNPPEIQKPEKSQGFRSLFVIPQHLDRVANVVVGGVRAVTCRRASQFPLEHVPGVVLFNLAGNSTAFAVPIVR